MSNLTYNIKLQFSSKEDENLMLQTLLEHQKVWNYLSEYVYKSKNIDKKLIHDKNYHTCRKIFPNAPSQIIIRAKDSVYATYKTLKSNKKLSKISEPCTQTNLSIRLDKRLYKFLDNNRIKFTTIEKRITANYIPYPKFSEMIGKYNTCDPLIYKKNDETWLSVSFEVPEPMHIENSYLGIDLGERRLVVTSEGNAYVNKKFLKQKRKIRYLKRLYKSKYDTTHSHSAKTKLRSLKLKEHNLNKNECHIIANWILKTKCNTIVMEDLTSLKKKKLCKANYKNGKSSKNRLSQMPFRMLREILTYKAPLLGKKVVTVNPYRTSLDDYRGIVPGIRKGCRYYSSDKTILDADWNGSINVANKYKTNGRKLSEELHPVSFNIPLDGKLNFSGKACQQPNCSDF